MGAMRGGDSNFEHNWNIIGLVWEHCYLMLLGVTHFNFKSSVCIKLQDLFKKVMSKRHIEQFYYQEFECIRKQPNTYKDNVQTLLLFFFHF